MNPFKASPRLGFTPPPETPYQRAGQVWDARIGAPRVQAANWRLMALGLLALSGGLAGSLAWLAAQGTVTPWVVQVDRLGQVQAVGPASRDYTPSDGELGTALMGFVEDVRSISSDPVVVGKAWDRVYAYVDGDARRFVTAYANTVVQKEVGKSQVDVEATSAERVSPETFRLAWIERHYAQGELTSQERWSAMLTITRRKPTTPKEIKLNGMGLKVTKIGWSREFGS